MNTPRFFLPSTLEAYEAQDHQWGTQKTVMLIEGTVFYNDDHYFELTEPTEVTIEAADYNFYQIYRNNRFLGYLHRKL